MQRGRSVALLQSHTIEQFCYAHRSRMLTASLFPNQLGQFTQSLAVLYIKTHLILRYVAMLLETTILQMRFPHTSCSFLTSFR